MSKKEQLLILSPASELVFSGNFMKGATRRLSLENPTDKRIMYKIKTTAPKKYCVRPNGGTIDPKCLADIFIFLLPDVFDPNEMNKHKFMVQSIVAPDGDVEDFENLWKEVSPDQIMGSKLRCVFENVEKTSTAKPSDRETSAAFINNESSNKGTSVSDQNDDVKIQDVAKEAVSEMEDKLLKIESQLRQRHLEQQEEILRSSLPTHSESTIRDKPPISMGSTPYGHEFKNTYSPPPVVNQQVSPMVIAIAVALVVIGLFIGKYVL